MGACISAGGGCVLNRTLSTLQEEQAHRSMEQMQRNKERVALVASSELLRIQIVSPPAEGKMVTASPGGWINRAPAEQAVPEGWFNGARSQPAGTFPIDSQTSADCVIEIRELATVRVLLENAAEHLGLDKVDARMLQLKFNDVTLSHEIELTTSGLCDGARCSVLGVEEAKASKANKVGVFAACRDGRVALVRLVCQYAPQRVNAKNSVRLLHTNTSPRLMQLWAVHRKAPLLFIGQQGAIDWRWRKFFSKPEQQLMSSPM